MDELQVRDVMTHLVCTAVPGDRVREVAQRLVHNGISGLPVVHRGRLIGVLSEADIVRNPEARYVREVMSAKPISTTPDTSLWAAARSLERRGLKRLPVVDEEGYVVGIITRSDLVRAMASQGPSGDLKEETKDVPAA
jgi:CBS domain-containing protein